MAFKKGHIPWNEGLAMTDDELTKRRQHGFGFKTGNIPWIKNRHHSEETRRKMRLSHLGKSPSTKGKHWPKRNYNWKGGKIARICKECGRQFKVYPTQIRRTGGKFCSISCASKYRIKHSKINWNKKPTKPELQMIGLIEKYNLPYKYTGDGSFWIEYLNPDFVECNGRKVALEVFGDYWHNRKNMSYCQTLEGRKAILERYGWKLVVVWEHELNTLPDQEILRRLEV